MELGRELVVTAAQCCGSQAGEGLQAVQLVATQEGCVGFPTSAVAMLRAACSQKPLWRAPVGVISKIFGNLRPECAFISAECCCYLRGFHSNCECVTPARY